MRTERGESEHSELKQLILETKQAAEEARDFAKSVKNYIRWIQITSILRLILIAVPLALAFIYLPPLLRQLGGVYGNFFGTTPQGSIFQQFLGNGEPTPEQLKNFTGQDIQGFLRNLQQPKK